MIESVNHSMISFEKMRSRLRIGSIESLGLSLFFTDLTFIAYLSYSSSSYSSLSIFAPIRIKATNKGKLWINPI